MKKFMTVLVAITVLVSTFALADDLSALTDDELLALRQEVLEEMERRGLSAEPKTASDLAEITLYYQPEGGNYYHLDQNCRGVNPMYLPLQDRFLYSDLNDEPYRDLQPCAICGAPVRPVSMNSRDAVNAAGEASFIADLIKAVRELFLNTISSRDDGIFPGHNRGSSGKASIPEEKTIKNTVVGNMKTYDEMTDGTWRCDHHTYQYRLEIKGRMPNAAVDSTFVYLSNLEEISFQQAYLAAGISSNLEDYFSPEDAVLVEMN